MKKGWQIFIRSSAVLLYFAFFASAYLGLYIFLGNTTTIQDSRTYTAENKPDYFPMLVMDQGRDGHKTLQLRSLAVREYSGSAKTTEHAWHLYQPTEGQTEETHHLAKTDGVTYQFAQLSPQRVQITIGVAEANSQRVSTYTYELEADQAYPHSYLLTSSFGGNFSPLPFLLILTSIVIYLSEKFLVKRLLRRYKN